MSCLRKRVCVPPAASGFTLGPYGAAALVACGGPWRREVRGLALLAACFRRETGTAPSAPLPLARALCEWLWQRRPRQYRPGGNPLLTRAVQAHLTPGCEEVGNCLALTCLLLALGESLGLPLAACHLPDAGGRGPHVLAILLAEKRELDLETTRPDGFDHPGLKELPGRRRWAPSELAAEVLLARGNRMLEAGRPRSARALYRRALSQAPEHGRAWLNQGIAYSELGQPEKARECFSRAVSL